MSTTVADFVAALRAAGLRVSPAEAIDAARALDTVQIGDRERVRQCLRLTCAKSRRSQHLFDRTFDGFFRRPRAVRGSGRSALADGVSGASPGDTPGERSQPPARPSPARPLTAAVSTAVVLRPSAPVATRPGRRGLQILRPLRTDGKPSPLGHEPAAAATGRGARQSARAPGRFAAGALSPQALARLQRLRLRLSRRRRPARGGRFSVQRTVRASLRTDGVPYRLVGEVRRRRRSRLVVVLDVSWSVTAAAGTLLRIVADLLDAIPRVRVVAFVDRPIECTRTLLTWARQGGRLGATSRGLRTADGSPPEAGFAQALAAVPGLDLTARSDYGRVGFRLTRETRLVDRDTVLIVLGDGRSNQFDPQLWAWAEVFARARLVAWLVPEPLARWGTGDSALADYLPLCAIAVEATDSDGLVHGFDAIATRMFR